MAAKYDVVDIKQDTEYCERSDGFYTEDKNWDISKNKLDLFLPKNSDVNTPVVVFVHGGGWRRGDRRAYKHYFSCYDTNLLVALVMAYYDAYWNVGRGFARNGIACAVISYRLSRLEFPWLLIELCASILISVIVVLTPLVLVALFVYCISNTVYGFHLLQTNAVDNGVKNGTKEVIQDLPLSLLTMCIIVILISLFVLWFIVCQNGEGYFIIPGAKFYPLLLSLLFSSLCLFSLDIELVSFASCLIICTALSLLHSFVTFQKSCRPIIRHPQHIKDVASSVAWVVQHGQSSKRFNPNKVFLCGHSAGGHLVSLLALDPKYLNNVGLTLSEHIKGVVSVSGVYNLHRLAGGFIEQMYLKPAFGTNHYTWTLASPYHRLHMLPGVSKKSSNSCPESLCFNNEPSVGAFRNNENSKHSKLPFLVINAEVDFRLLDDAKSFVALLKEKGFECQHFIIGGSNHLTVILAFGSQGFSTTSESVQKITIEGLCLQFIRGLSDNN